MPGTDLLIRRFIGKPDNMILVDFYLAMSNLNEDPEALSEFDPQSDEGEDDGLGRD
jgi:hypothetical protein